MSEAHAPAAADPAAESATAAAASRPVCPISLEAIPEGAEFDLGCGTPFDVRSVLDLVLVQGAAAAHPYTRQPLGAEVLRRVHAAALAHPETRDKLVERGLDGEEAFAAHVRRAAAGARSEMDQRSLVQLLDTAWAGIMDRAVTEGRVAAEDLQDIISIGIMLHRSSARLRNFLFARLERHYEDSTNLEELARLHALGEILHQSLRRSTFLAPTALLGDVVERAPPMSARFAAHAREQPTPGWTPAGFGSGFAPAAHPSAAAAAATAASSSAAEASFERMVRSLDQAAAMLDRVSATDRRHGARSTASAPRSDPFGVSEDDPAAGAVIASILAAAPSASARYGYTARLSAAPFWAATPSGAAGGATATLSEEALAAMWRSGMDRHRGGSAGTRPEGPAEGGRDGIRGPDGQARPAAAPAAAAAAAAAVGAASPPQPQLIASPVPLGPPVRSADATWSLAVVNCLLATDHTTLPEHAREFLRARLRHEAESVAARLGGASSPSARELMLAVVRDGRDAVAAGAAVSAEAADSNAGMLRGIVDDVFAAVAAPAAAGIGNSSLTPEPR